MMGGVLFPRVTTTLSGLEVRLYPNVVEFWQHGHHVFSLTPSEYGYVHRWINGELHDIAEGILW